jgi:hypothetical protein
MGPFMVEIVYCRVTRRGRKKKKGMNKLARENMRNDGPAFQFLPPEDTVKITLDLSENGPVFSALVRSPPFYSRCASYLFCLLIYEKMYMHQKHT